MGIMKGDTSIGQSVTMMGDNREFRYDQRAKEATRCVSAYSSTRTFVVLPRARD